jgi:drug/metabolite transporter (DMT)-like permease
MQYYPAVTADLLLAGTAMVTLADGSASGDAGQNLLGDALCVLSALLYSGYTVSLQAQLRHDSPEAPALFFGVIGCMTAVVGMPLLGCGQLLGWFDARQLQPQALALAGINGETQKIEFGCSAVYCLVKLDRHTSLAA